MSDFTKSIVYSGFVLVAGLIAIFAISSNMTATQQTAAGFATVEPAAGEEAATTIPADEASAAWDSEKTLSELRKALEEAGVEVSKTEPAAGEPTTTQQPTVTIDTTESAQ